MDNSREETIAEKLEEFEKLSRDSKVNRLDEDFLKRFLVGRQYDVVAALRAAQNFESFIERRRETWLKLKKTRIEVIIQSRIVEILDNLGRHGQQIVWIRVEKWDPQIVTADEILEVSGLLCELLYAKTSEVKYIDIILDLHNFSLKHVYALSPKFAKRMVFFMAECLPMVMLHIYVLRQPKIFHLVYSLFKPFLEENIRKSIKICGYNYEFLLTTIGRDNLPPELDGDSGHLDPNRWINLFYNEKTQKELKLSGYEFF